MSIMGYENERVSDLTKKAKTVHKKLFPMGKIRGSPSHRHQMKERGAADDYNVEFKTFPSTFSNATIILILLQLLVYKTLDYYFTRYIHYRDSCVCVYFSSFWISIFIHTVFNHIL